MRKVNVRLVAAAALLAGATTYLAYLGSKSDWQHFVHVQDASAQLDQLAGKRVRIQGQIAAQSLTIEQNGQSALFTLVDGSSSLPVVLQGQFPRGVRENSLVVVEGKLSRDGRLHGERLLTDFPAEATRKVPTTANRDQAPTRR